MYVATKMMEAWAAWFGFATTEWRSTASATYNTRTMGILACNFDSEGSQSRIRVIGNFSKNKARMGE
jgi:hypothetical protein